jgi:hypothetical protein
MITAWENKASTVIMDCRDNPGKDNGWVGIHVAWYYGADRGIRRLPIRDQIGTQTMASPAARHRCGA